MFKYIKINTLIIEGFKCYKNKTEIELSDITKVIGDNEKGKTTIGEAIAWAFLGCNLWGNDKLDSKLLNDSSKKMQVTVKFTDGEKDYILNRSRYGSTTNILLNHKTVKQADLTSMIGNKDIFLSIFNPEYFNSIGKDGRDLLITILPNINAQDILAKIDDFLIVYIGDELELIHNNPNLFMQNKRTEIRELETDLVFNEGVLSKLNVSESIGKLKAFDSTRLEELEEELDNISFGLQASGSTEHEKLLEEKLKLEKEIIELRSKEFVKIETIEETKDIAYLEKEIPNLEKEKYESPDAVTKQILTLEADYISLRNDYKKQQDSSLKEGDKCPTCKTIMDHNHFSIFLEEFTQNITALANKGREKAKELSELKNKIELREKEFNRVKELKLEELRDKYNSLSERIKLIDEANMTNSKIFHEKKEKAILTLQSKIALIEDKIKRIKSGYVAYEEQRLKDVNLRKEELKQQIVELRKEKAQIDAYNMEIKILAENREKNLVEREELLEENKVINERITNYKNQVEVCKQYTNLKVKILSELMHSHLQDVTIELQKIVKSTGELKDCFEIKYKGNSYNTISRSGTIKVGLEISNLIRKITGYNYPIFVDNAESITKYTVSEEIQLIETKVVEGKDISITLKDADSFNIAV